MSTVEGCRVPAIATIGAAAEPFGAEWFVMQRLAGIGCGWVPSFVTKRWLHSVEPWADAKPRSWRPSTRSPCPPDAFGEHPPADRVARLETERWSRALVRTPTADTAAMRSAIDLLRVTEPAPPRQVCIVHSDYRTGNLLYDPQGAQGSPACSIGKWRILVTRSKMSPGPSWRHGGWERGWSEPC